MVKALKQRSDFLIDLLIVVVLLGAFFSAVQGSRAAYTGIRFLKEWQPWWDGFLQNSGTEMLGAFLTFILLEVIRGGRQRRAEEARHIQEQQDQEEAEERRARELRELQQTVADELQKQIRRFIQAQEIARLQTAQTPEERQRILDGMLATKLLKEAYLRETNLERVNLWQANLKGAHLKRANLKGACLVWAKLTKALLYNANLEEAEMDGANLEKAHLDGANLKGTSLAGANLKEASLAGANLTGAYLRKANLTEAHLERANLTGALLEGANLEAANLWQANLKGAHLERANLEAAYFEGATIPDGTELPGRTLMDMEQCRIKPKPEPDWRTPFEAWDKAGRPRIEPTADEPENSEES